MRAGELTFRFLSPVPELSRGFALLPADPCDPHVYRIDLGQDGLEPVTVVFGRDSGGSTSRLALDVMPLVLDKQPDTTNPRRRATRAAAVIGTSVAVAGLGLRVLRACGSTGDGGCC